MGRFLRLFLECLVVGCVLLPALAFSAPVQGVLDRPALKVRNPAGCILIDVAMAGSRVVAVGERGIITYSDDAGKTWLQADVPVSVTLTAVCFPSSQNGWAVGHGGVVIATKDAGKTWIRQMEGIAAAKLALEAAKANADRMGADNEAARALLGNVELLSEDGPDKPFLDVYFRNDLEGYVIGSYGYFFQTQDGGATWTSLMDRVENPDGLNLYAIRVVNGTTYIVGEQGLFLISTDNGGSFKKIETPYAGTYFDLEATSAGEIILVGLRGHTYWSSDFGQTFSPSEVSDEVTFTNVERLPDGTLLFANQAGMLLESTDHGKTIHLVETQRLDPIASIVPMDGDTLMTVGYGGAIRVELPSLGATGEGGAQ